MRWLTMACVLALAALTAVAGCGSTGDLPQGGSDALTLSFVRFDNVGFTQSDAVRGTSADIDVCASICSDLSIEPFTQAGINAVFVNRGKADILLDRYTIEAPGSGVPGVTRQFTANVIGGRCDIGDTEKACASDAECTGSIGEVGSCVHRETIVDLLLYDFEFKDRIRNGSCPTIGVDDAGNVVFIPGTVTSDTFDVFLTFSGTSLAGDRLTVSTSYVSTFADFLNCQ